MKCLLFDNYDSFTYNLRHMLLELGLEVDVRRNDRITLDGEYKRDLGKGLPIDLPKNYYKDDDPENKPLLLWRAHANNLYTNWLNYYVYQSTPFDLYGTPDFDAINDGK